MLFTLIREALWASGVKDKDRFIDYQAKIDQLCGQVWPKIKELPDPVAKAKTLFNWLWHKKPSRYQARGSFRLDEVLDAQLSPGSQSVGNCLGLTLLYNCLLARFGVEAKAILLEQTFGLGPHVLSLLETESLSIDVENIFPEGFDYQGHLKNPSRKKWGSRELVADIYHSLANESFERGDFLEAERNYDRALELYSGYETARLNRAILFDKMAQDRN